MYKMLLCSRYLRTRFIALASIVSVMLGVATMIVVNSVMSGFQAETYKRLHGILSDLVIESHGLEGIQDPAVVMAQTREVLGDDIDAMTANVHVPAMLHLKFRGQIFTKQINLIGIDRETYADVGDFAQYLLHPENREKLSFGLKYDGYGERFSEAEMGTALPGAGWPYRRERVMLDRLYEQQRQRMEAAKAPKPPVAPASGAATANTLAQAEPESGESLSDIQDPFAELAPDKEDIFDAAKETHMGIVLGIALASERMRNKEGEVIDFYLCRPGDDVQVTFPTSGMPPKPASSYFTVVDLYESKMSEYDATFAFIPIEELQRLRGMIDPESGIAAVSAIQVRLKPDADLYACREKLRERFPANIVPFHVQSWKDMQGPLL
ncbi:MAG: ABC transporter permease, partial [Planctomycetota bacterium]